VKLLKLEKRQNPKFKKYPIYRKIQGLSYGMMIAVQLNKKDVFDRICNAKLVPYDDGYFDPYYDGLSYLFGLM
jgi:hypothetical protein